MGTSRNRLAPGYRLSVCGTDESNPQQSDPACSGRRSGEPAGDRAARPQRALRGNRVSLASSYDRPGSTGRIQLLVPGRKPGDPDNSGPFGDKAVPIHTPLG
jgi:hypothetical protein